VVQHRFPQYWQRYLPSTWDRFIDFYLTNYPNVRDLKQQLSFITSPCSSQSEIKAEPFRHHFLCSTMSGDFPRGLKSYRWIHLSLISSCLAFTWDFSLFAGWWMFKGSVTRRGKRLSITNPPLAEVTECHLYYYKHQHKYLVGSELNCTKSMLNGLQKILGISGYIVSKSPPLRENCKCSGCRVHYCTAKLWMLDSIFLKIHPSLLKTCCLSTT
jgi:hypothetical protein